MMRSYNRAPMLSIAELSDGKAVERIEDGIDEAIWSVQYVKLVSGVCFCCGEDGIQRRVVQGFVATANRSRGR